MNTFKKLALAAGLCAAGLTSQAVHAQSTDGYHSIQIFPVVVDTASFAQRFTFRNPNATNVTVSMSYFPATGTTQASPIGCGNYVVNANSERTFTSLRAICPTLAGGSQFGFLYTYEINAANLPYSGFSRVANPQGNGFSVEAFPAHTFTSATSTVTGVRRLAATLSSPAYQTNCFVGNVNDVTAPGTAVTTTVSVYVYDSSNALIGTTSVNLIPGQITRLSDIFNVVGKPTGDYDNARVMFSESGTGEPGIMAFCTVQDNTSFGADFRIAKQEYGDGASTMFQQDDHVGRDTTFSADIVTSYTTGGARAFKLLSGGARHNIHVVYFRHPDWVQCELINPSTGVRALTSYGLEMRLMAEDGTTLVAGGNDSTGFGETYLGDKTDYNFGANGRYTIEVENNSGNAGADIPYYLHCQSGSGHTMGDMIEYGVGTEKF